jgi:cell fate regulator YaaT (PSP1 superfamily)
LPTVVGVRLRSTPKTLWFDPVSTTPETGDFVVVETERGTEFGEVVEGVHEVATQDLPAALKPVLRVATEEDVTSAEDLMVREAEALPVFKEAAEKSDLDIKAVGVEYLFGGDKAIFYFTAEDRVDFRELVRELAAIFGVRVDMRQIGVRDEARLVGGVGHCGQPLCCVRFGGEFQPVSIRMAKEQDLPLNPLKISGLCGRLMCCLRYEYDAYKDFKSRAPKRGAMIETPAGAAKVVDFNTPRELVTVRTQEGANVTVPLDSMGCCKGETCPCAIDETAFAAALGTREAAVALVAGSGSGAAGTQGRREAPKPRDAGSERPGQSTGGGRRRRDRGRGSRTPRQDGSGAQRQGQNTQPTSQASTTQQAPQTGQAGATKPPGAESTGQGRRRRRRRSSGGGAGSGEQVQ